MSVASSEGTRGHRRRRIAVPVLVAVVAAGGTAAALAGPWERGGGASDRAAVAFDLVTVEQGSLSSGIQLTGTLVHDAPVPVAAAGKGVLTALPAVGSVVRAGERLYETDGQPVVLMTGQRPLWRDLGPGAAEGPDVEQLKRNLIDLGFAHGLGLTADRAFTPATATAVKRWQKSLGVRETGTVALGSVVMLPEKAVRVQQLGTRLGSAVGGDPVLTVTRTDLVVTVQPAENQVSRFKPDGRVRIRLADGTTVDGRVRSLVRGSADGEEKPGAGSDGPGAKATAVLVLDGQEKAQQAGPSPVTVTVVGDTAENALIVPVTALLALDGGGYGVRVSEGGATRLVRVQLGLIADAKAQITGQVAAGAQVVIPK
ncbi:peptidoglycan-binding protein [Kitasatospora sp. NPDC051853]|uniref:peptidoglycan-binding protein n=1 Tax=Kitasatospora sp. NPDC051853 TaxID=3364058 RepID=UPI0037AFB140